MIRLYSKTKFPAPKQRRHLPLRTWLVHVAPLPVTQQEPGYGFVHFLIVARTLEAAFEEALDLPRQPGTAPKLGGVIEASNWPAFMRCKQSEYCAICTKKSLLLAGSEERAWETWATAFEEGYKEVIS